ncbi:uncharacterized protein DS421_14g471640 [Arachis hypogaea]|nr:uncharacterized protein DS421_14g471640 [Arachis hypogaea]
MDKGKGVMVEKKVKGKKKKGVVDDVDKIVEEVFVWDPADPYGWVSESVKGWVSVFDDDRSISQLGSPSSWIRVGSGVNLRFLPCNASDRVFHCGESFEYFYMYSAVFVGLGVRFPFSEFERGVLMQLKCAPSQLHPNSWAFVRAFEILMGVLEIEALLKVFFALFQCKGVKRGYWLNLASAPGRAIFSLYRSSFKGFKSMFLRVGVVESDFLWYIDDCLLETFPLFWVPRPRQIFGMDRMEYENEMVVEFLVNHISSSSLLFVVDILELETDSDALSEYIGK